MTELTRHRFEPGPIGGRPLTNAGESGSVAADVRLAQTSGCLPF
jgi:hypothetical protein